MFSQDEINTIKRRAIQKRDLFTENHPGIQVPPDEGPQTLMLVAEIERLYALAQSAITTRSIVAA